MAVIEINPVIPAKCAPILNAARYKALYGGRGGAKSHTFAEVLIFLCTTRTIRAACVREYQNSLRDSCRQLLIDKIRARGVQDFWEITENELRGPQGSLIIFRGMQSYNAENLKSLEGTDIVWVEEAQTLSPRSLRMLRPTVRKSGSEIWFSWNPRHENDPVDAFFRGPHPPSDAIIIECGLLDNPWRDQVLVDEWDHDWTTDPDMAEHVWGGGYEIISEASYYAKWIRAAEQEGRIASFPHDPKRPVFTSWDIGVDDYSAVWFWQIDEFAHHATVIDYYETQNEGAKEIIEQALPEYHGDVAEGARQLLRLGRFAPFRYGKHFFPHDVKIREWGAGARSRIETLVELGLRDIHRGAAVGPEERIAASRKLLPMVRFNNTKRVQVGISRLRRYSRKLNEQLMIYTGPLHDQNSHGADAFGEYAVNCPLVAEPVEQDRRQPQPKGTVLLPGAPKPRTGSRIRI